MQISDLPKYHDLMRPTLVALEKIGGSASLNEVNDAVIDLIGLPAEALEVPYASGSGNVIYDRLSWARSYLKTGGFLVSGGRGIYLLTDEGRKAIGLPEATLKRTVAAAIKQE